MSPLLTRELDAAQAMTYNEYAEVLETRTRNGRAVPADDLAVIDFNDIGTAMLQDAIWADAGRLNDGVPRDRRGSSRRHRRLDLLP